VTLSPRKAIAVARARELLNELHIREPSEIDIERIALFKNVLVRYEPLHGMDGRIVREGNAAIVTINNALKFDGQKRFVIAHELAHFFLHPKTRQIETIDAEQINNWSEKQEIEEYEANLFAAELLMPEFLFAPRIKGKKPSFDLVESLIEEFHTTFTATAVQYVFNTTEECAIVSSAQRQRLWFILSHGFSFQMLEESDIHGCSCAAEVSANKRSCKSSQIEAGYWLEGFRGDHKSCITEDARFFPTLKRSLSLLWIHDAI
jgi:Zn-dependent peptidase ImmA (M78 family)